MSAYLVHVNISAHLGILFDFIQEFCVVPPLPAIATSDLLLFLSLIFIFDLLHVKTIELPDTSVLPFADLRESLFDDNDVRQLVLVRVVEVFQLLHSHLREIIAEDSIVEVNEFSKVGVGDESTIVPSEVLHSHQLNLHHSEVLLGGCLAGVHIEVDLVNVDDHELGQSVARAD